MLRCFAVDRRFSLMASTPVRRLFSDVFPGVPDPVENTVEPLFAWTVQGSAPVEFQKSIVPPRTVRELSSAVPANVASCGVKVPSVLTKCPAPTLVL